MFGYIWPLVLVVLSNTAYQICAKSAPSIVHPLASLTVTYLVGAMTSAVLYFVLSKGGNLFHELGGINKSTVILGVVIVGLEVGSIFAYRAGWNVSTFSIVHSSILAAVLLAVGGLVYREQITLKKVIGVLICAVGLYFLNAE